MVIGYNAGPLALAPIEDAMFRPWKAHGFFDHFYDYDVTATTGRWVETERTGSGAKADAAGGVVRLSGTTTDDQGAQIQSASESWLAAAGKPIYAEARVKISDVDKCQFFFGFCTTDTTIMASGVISTATVTEAFGLYMDADSVVAAAGKLQAISFDATGEDNTTSATEMGLTDATWHRIGFIYDVTNLEMRCYIDGVFKKTLTLTAANVPTGEVALSFLVHSEATPGATLTCDIDYVAAYQEI
jgi:hypothetical protein